MGKTAFAMNVAINVARRTNKTVLVFTKEMTAKELVNRSVATICGVQADILRRRVPVGADYDMLQDALDQVVCLPILLEESNDQTIDQIREIARREKKNVGEIGLIVVDYLQLVRGSRTENRTQEVGEVSRGIKAMAREIGCPAIALAQLSRETERRDKANKRPQLSDLRESGSIEQDSDIVIGMYRDEYYNPPSVGSAQNPNHVEPAEFIVMKNRSGPTGTITLGFQAAYTRFREFDTSRENYERKAYEDDVARDRVAFGDPLDI